MTEKGRVESVPICFRSIIVARFLYRVRFRIIPLLLIQLQYADYQDSGFIQQIEGSTHEGHIDNIRGRGQQSGQDGYGEYGIPPVPFKMTSSS